MYTPTQHKFRHLFYTTRVPIDDTLCVSSKGWQRKESAVQYGEILLDEFRCKPDMKEFQYEHGDGSRIRFISGRLEWKPRLKHMAVALLKPDVDLSFAPDRPWKDVVAWPLEKYEPDSFEFKILSLNYQKLAATCDGNNSLVAKIQKNLEDVEVEMCQEWLNRNYIPSKPSLKELIDQEFIRFVTCFDEQELANWMDDRTRCLHWTGTYDFKTFTAMFKRSTKLSGKNKRRNVNVKELLYQFFVENLGGYMALYLDFDKCVHKSKCVNPHHFQVARRQSLNNNTKRRKLIAASAASGNELPR